MYKLPGTYYQKSFVFFFISFFFYSIKCPFLALFYYIFFIYIINFNININKKNHEII